MTSVLPGSDTLVFHTQEDIVTYLLRNVLGNTVRKIGTEWEMFFVRPDGTPITRQDGQKVFVELQKVFGLQGYDAQFIHEINVIGEDKIVGLTIKDLGAIIPEAGYQFEFACSVSNDIEEIFEKNEVAHTAFLEVALRMDYEVIFKGHIPGYAEKTEGMDRSRGIQWRSYYEKRFGAHALLVREAQDATAAVQVTVDSGAEKFHEFFQALLLIEPALTLHYANSARSYIGIETYGHMIPSQVLPVTSVWGTSSPQEAIKVIVERLMKIEVPFLPDEEHPGLYRAEPFLFARPPTVKDLMEQGRLSEKALINIGGFFYTRPSLRNFAQALLEVRGMDSQASPAIVAEIAQRVANIVYDDQNRTKLLADYAHLTAADIEQFHEAAAMKERRLAMQKIVASVRVTDFVDDIIVRSEPESFGIAGAGKELAVA